MIEKLADNRTGTEEGKDPFGAGTRYHRHFEQALVNPIAAVTRVAGQEKNLVGGEPHRLRTGKQVGRETSRQPRQQARARTSSFRHAASPPWLACAGEHHAAELVIIKARPDARSGRGSRPCSGLRGVWGPIHPLLAAAGPLGGGSGGRAGLRGEPSHLLPHAYRPRPKGEVTAITENTLFI